VRRTGAYQWIAGWWHPRFPKAISPEFAAAARDTLGGALSVAGQIPDGRSYPCTDGARCPDHWLHVTSAIGAVISIVMRVAVAIYLRAPRPRVSGASALSCELEPSLAC